MALVKGEDLLLYKNTSATAEVVEVVVSGVTSTGGDIVISNLAGSEVDQTIDTTGLTPTAAAAAIQLAMDALTSYSASVSGATVTITSLVNGEQELSLVNASTELKTAVSTIVSGKDAGKEDIAFATSTTLNVNSNLLDASVKQSSGYLVQCAAQRSWDISAEHLVTLDSTGNDENLASLFEMYEAQETINFHFETSVGGGFNGTGIISALSVNAPNEELSTLSVTISGTGQLISTL